MTALLEIEGIAKSFGAVRSLIDITFSVEDHGIVGLIGPNGAGKSTLINVLTGVYAPDGGTVQFAGRDLGGLATAERARLGLVRTFQRPTPIFDLSCIEGVMVGGLVRGLSVGEARSAALDILALLGLRAAADQSPRKLPTGHLKLLDFARVLMLAPRLVLLDELMAGLSFNELEVVLGTIERLADGGISFLVVEHLLDVIKRLSRHLVVMDAGIIVAAGEPAEVIRDPRVIEAYLGEEAGAVSVETEPALVSSPIAFSDGEPVSTLPEDARAGPMLEVKGLATGYEGVEVVHGIDLVVKDGETVCILGANGAGKSTTLRAVMRQLPCWRGHVRFLGEDLTNAKAFAPAHVGIGYVPEGRGMLASLTVRENLEMGAYPGGARDAFARNLERVLSLFPALVPRLGDAAANLSGGQQQMLAIGRVLMGSPKLVLLDEPSLGLAPQIVSQVYAALTELKSSGQAILLVEQTVGKALALSDRAYVLDGGKVVLTGPSDKVRNDKLLRDAYLGL
jgi:ABC-type branched-subunit amino acid transport system ATPase component